MIGPARCKRALRATRRSLDGFVKLNQRASEKLARILPHTRADVFPRYAEAVAQTINRQPEQLVVDVGAGHVCPYIDLVRATSRPRLVGIDLSLERMARNEAMAEKLTADVVADGLPFGDAEVDIVTSRSVLEHLSNVERLVAESARVLKPGGYSIHLLSGRRSHIALMNRLLPEKLGHTLLHAFHPGSRGVGGQPANYDRCYYQALVELFRRHHHGVVDVYAYYGSNYFYSLLPMFIVETLYLVTIQVLRVRSLAVNYLVVAQRTPAP